MTTIADRKSPLGFHVMAKPTGAICNLDCTYCYFLKKEELYPDSKFRMSDDVLEAYLRQLLDAHAIPRVTVSWQGGEPTLMGLDFFRKSIDLQKKLNVKGAALENTIQTNGTRLTDDWCRFFKENNYLVGLSMDGPRACHDAYRVDKRHEGTFDRVMRGADLLRRHEVDFNILCTLHEANAEHPLEVYRFFRDDVGARYVQFIPIVERVNSTGFQEGGEVTPRSITAEQYGAFLIAVFDEWVRHDVGAVFVQIFDVTLGTVVGAPPNLCIFSPTCGLGLALEHNGDLYSCDHFVEPKYLLGNITQHNMMELVDSAKQREFGQSKLTSLPRYCRQCDVLSLCYGGCPKDRFINTPEGEPGLNYLCAGYKAFFSHVQRPMRGMAWLIRNGHTAKDIMDIMSGRKQWSEVVEMGDRRNELCPCGSGLRVKHCHGQPDALAKARPGGDRGMDASNAGAASPSLSG